MFCCFCATKKYNRPSKSKTQDKLKRVSHTQASRNGTLPTRRDNDEMIGRFQTFLHIPTDKPTTVSKTNFWRTFHGSTFVSSFTKASKRSEDVWCCMRHVDDNAMNSVYQNLEYSLLQCLKDPRTSETRPQFVDISVMAPRHRWRVVNVDQLHRERHRTIGVQLSGYLGVTIYLPSVWDERSHWTATELISHLTSKAGGGNGNITIYEIDCYVIEDMIESTDHGLFQSDELLLDTKSSQGLVHTGSTKDDLKHNGIQTMGLQVPDARKTTKHETVDRSHTMENMSLSILEKCLAFYTSNIQKTKSGTELMYSKEDRIVFAMEAHEFVRSFGDVAAFYKLAHFLKNSASMTLAKDVVTYAMTWSTTSDHQVAAQVNMLIKVGQRDAVTGHMMDRLVRASRTETDVSFALPQIILALVNFAPADNIKVAQSFVLRYKKSFMREALASHRVFAANWILQALAVCFPIVENGMKEKIKTMCVDSLIPVCVAELQSMESVTSCACALTGLLSVPIDISPHFALIKRAITTLQEIQTSEGGFHYHFNKDTSFRLDVTSHVVEACLAIQTTIVTFVD